MQSSNHAAEGGGLNFVFESGSAGRENKKYVRSHAAKVGWSQRTRNRKEGAAVVAKDADIAPRKRRKMHTDSAPQHGQISNAPDFDTHLGAGPSSAASSYTLEPVYSSAPCSSSSSTLSSTLHQAQHASVRLYERGPSHSPLSYSPPEGHSAWHGRPAPIQNAAVTRPYSVSPYPLQPRPDVHASEPVYSAPRPTSLPSPSLLPSTSAQPLPPGHVPSLDANWRQYDHVQSMTSTPSQPPTLIEPEMNLSDENHRAAVDKAPKAAPSKRTSTPAFLDLVLNEEHPMWKPVDSGNNSFKVFPVKWQPFYGRLLANYHSNMMVQLDEILTGWSVSDKLEFNQMPLRLAGAEPSLFYALMATASIMMPPGLINPAIPTFLQARTVKCLNEAFEDSNRAYSDAIILTVNMVALFESTSGHAEVAATLHQPMLRKMVDKRGGLKLLNAKDTLDSSNLVRFLAWTDRIIKCQTGNPLIFSDFEEDPSVAKTNWDDIWARMEKRVEDNMPAPVEELPDAE